MLEEKTQCSVRPEFPNQTEDHQRSVAQLMISHDILLKIFTHSDCARWTTSRLPVLLELGGQLSATQDAALHVFDGCSAEGNVV